MSSLDPTLQAKDAKPQAVLSMLSTDLGTRADIPTRSLEVLRTADLVIFEEAKLGRQFLKAAGVHRDFHLFSEHHQQETLEAAKDIWRKGGTVSYMSDQGSANFADPGYQLVTLARSLKVSLRVVPGPNSVAAALSACPFAVERFTYVGFLARDESRRRQELERFGALNMPLVILDTPYRLGALLSSWEQTLPKRKGLLAIEIGNPDEEYWYGWPADIRKQVGERKRHNFVLVLR